MTNSCRTNVDLVFFPKCGAPKKLCNSCPHGPGKGKVTSGSATTSIDGSEMSVRIDDPGTIKCAHGGTFKITSGQSNVLVDGKMSARVGDTAKCDLCGCIGKIRAGSHDTFDHQ